MTNRKKTKSNQRKPRSEEYKVEALKLADTIGVTAAAAQLGVQTSQIYAWRSKLHRQESSSDAENRLLDENAALKRQLAESKQEVDFLKKRRHTSRRTTSEVCLCP